MGLQKIVVLCVVVLAAGVGWYLYTHEQDTVTRESVSEVPGGADTNKTVEKDEPLSGLGSFAELIALGRNISCDFSYVSADTNGAVAGTVYIAGEKMRGDFDMEQAGQLFESHMIDDGEFAYTWTVSSQGTFAFKSPVMDSEASEEAESSVPPSRAVDMDHEVEYDCQTWRVDESMFIPPSDVEFVSPDMMMQEALKNYQPQ